MQNIKLGTFLIRPRVFHLICSGLKMGVFILETNVTSLVDC
jgi:hypothetical protein